MKRLVGKFKRLNDMKITAIHGGGDWCDASAEYLILGDICPNAEHKKWRKWYYGEYSPKLQTPEQVEYIDFYEWLKKAGAREPAEDELEIFDNY